ncbi:MAG: hypothetical protein JNL97_13225, partial [Verrucomicrobiales bacterium]|nr:hypothetical protein [Verrucomicrobiales bacterium]
MGASLLLLLDFRSAAQPRLDIEATGADTWVLRWSAEHAGYTLESSTALGPGANWTAVAQAPVVGEGVLSTTLNFAEVTRFFRLRREGIPANTWILETSPGQGETGVAVTRETVFRLSGPLATDAAVGTPQCHAESGGRRILSRAELSGDRRTLTLFYLENLPANARVAVTLAASGLFDATGVALDGDGDGIAGGTAVLTFETGAVTALPGTAVVGRVLASEKNPDGSDRPLENVVVTVDGAEETLRTTTDRTGAFRLEPAPAGRFFVHVDGRTAVGSRWPAGEYFPYVGKAWQAIAGRTNNLAGGSGVVFLPLVRADALGVLDPAGVTRISFPPAVLAANPTLAGAEIAVPPNALFNEGGLRGGRVGIAAVPPDRLPEPLPPGLRFPMVITVQTDGPQNFDQPVAVRFPNLPDPVTGVRLPPGAKTALWSFNHDTGRWEIQGSATITEDGNFAVTDPGVGIRQPGWHSFAPGTIGHGPRGGARRPKSASNSSDDDPFDLGLYGPDPECDRTFGYTVDCDKDGCPDHFLPCDCDAEAEAYHHILDYCRYDKIFKNSIGMVTCAFIDACPDPTWMRKWIDCRHQLDEKLAEWQICKARLGLSSASGSADRPRNLKPLGASDPVSEQLRLADLAAALMRNLLGAEAWLDLDPTSLAEQREVYDALAEARAEASPGGRQITPTETATVLAAGRPATLTVDHVQTAVRRLNATLDGSLPAADLQAIQQARDHYTAAYADLQQKGWTTPLDGYRAMESETSSQAERLAWESFFGERRPYYLLENLQNGFVVRGRLNASGLFDDLILPTDTYLRITYLDPVTGAIGAAVFRSNEPGRITEVPAAPLRKPVGAADRDGDGLADDAEFVLGSRVDAVDTDGDGLPDGDELREGLNPLDGVAPPLGAVANADSPGSSRDIALHGSYAYVSDTVAGLAIFDVSDPLRPVRVAQIPTPTGLTALAAEGDTLAAISEQTGSASVPNLFVWDISQPATPVLRYATGVSEGLRSIRVVAEEIWVGGQQGSLLLFDTLAPVSMLIRKQANRVDDIWVSRPWAYALAGAGPAGDPLLVLEHTASGWVARSSIGFSATPPSRFRARLHSDGSRLYATETTGFNVLDLARPDLPVHVSRAGDLRQGGWRQLVPSGAGRALAAVGATDSLEEVADLSAYSLLPGGTNAVFLTTYTTPGPAAAFAVRGAWAFVADVDAGLTVVRHLPPDFAGQPPTLRLESTADPLHFKTGAKDDVGIDRVEFYVDGQLRRTVFSPPFEVHLPRVVPQAGQGTVAIRARAVDTAGLEAWSETITRTIDEVRALPRVGPTSPGPGTFWLVSAPPVIGVTFSEPMDPASFASGFALVSAGPDGRRGTADDLAFPVTVRGTNGTAVRLESAQPLAPGTYEVRVLSTLSNPAGVRLASGRS